MQRAMLLHNKSIGCFSPEVDYTVCGAYNAVD